MDGNVNVDTVLYVFAHANPDLCMVGFHCIIGLPRSFSCVEAIPECKTSMRQKHVQPQQDHHYDEVFDHSHHSRNFKTTTGTRQNLILFLVPQLLPMAAVLVCMSFPTLPRSPTSSLGGALQCPQRCERTANGIAGFRCPVLRDTCFSCCLQMRFPSKLSLWSYIDLRTCHR